MKQFFAIFLCGFLTAGGLRATMQEPDVLIVDGIVRNVWGFRFDQPLQRKLFTYAETDARWMRASSNWRGYSATFQIKDSHLYLIGISFHCYEPKPQPAEILGFSIPENGVLMKDFSGQLYHPTGDAFASQMATSKPQTTEELMFEFKDGKLISKTLLKAKPSDDWIMERMEKDIHDLTAVLEKMRAKSNQPAAVPPPNPK